MNMETPVWGIEPIALSNESTVVAEFINTHRASEENYQSEAQLEQALLVQLQQQAYERIDIHTEADLISNLRAKLQALNHYTFSDPEWQRFLDGVIARSNSSIIDKTTLIQEDPVQLLERDDGSAKNIMLIDKHHVHNNALQVINQYCTAGSRSNRYDVTILVNGLPMVHVELKRRGIDIRQAFNQIERYQRDSFWAGSGLFEYVQLFVISNGTLTKYYSNTVRAGHLAEQVGNKRGRTRTSNSFAFTSWWADARNQPITDLMDFTKTFFSKHALLNILTRYCIFDVDRKLLVMRPYQIVASERILQRIITATNAKQAGSVQAGGYVWHTTGSGKTLTSFKAAQLARGLPFIDKVLFVVDRKDLDYQTMREYERFEKGAANSNTSTAVLQRQLEDPKARIIITTIQKLSRFVAKNRHHPIYGKHVVLIFDECHRSQFGDMHTDIVASFKKYHLFGFTGTPIFAQNAAGSVNPKRRTTPQAFGDRLHTYTIVDAITDKNVLPFRIDYINTIKAAPNVTDKQVASIDTERALLAPARIQQVTQYILEHFDQKTRRTGQARYEHTVVSNVTEVVNSKQQTRERRQRQRMNGFNALFAVSSIEAAKRYYTEFSKQQASLPPARKLRIGLIYSFAPNDLDEDGLLDEEGFETGGLDRDSESFLADAIQDYNALFATSYDTSTDKFQNYYKDLSQRLKNRELDMAIVVNMFLTGFDATTLNTLWVDKPLKAHGLIQAYSRTNRILNSVKVYGNIVSFRDLEQATNDALALFGNKDAQGIAVLRPYSEYYDKYKIHVEELLKRFPLTSRIIGESNQKVFINLFSAILRLRNILTAFDEFAGNEILTERQFQDYQSLYLSLHDDFKTREIGDKERIDEDVVFEIELIKQVEINVDYILMLVERYLKAKSVDDEGKERSINKDKEIRSVIDRAVRSSPSLRNKQDLINEFIDNISPSAEVDTAWLAFIERKKSDELDALIAEEKLKPEQTRSFVEDAFRDGGIAVNGTALTRILPPLSRFSRQNAHAEKKHRVLQKLQAFFERFSGLS